MTRYPHPALNQIEALEPLNTAPLYSRVYSDILVAGINYRPDQAEKWEPNIALFRALITAHRAYREQAGLFGDMFGEYLECTNQTSERNGQFFTPRPIVDLNVSTQFDDLDLARTEPYTVCDPACGTGRFMLSVADHFMTHNEGSLNFLMVNADIDRKAFTFCTMNAILNGIPGIHLHADTLRLEVWDAFVTLPVGMVAKWYRLAPEKAKRVLTDALALPVRKPPATVQSTLEVTG